MMTKKTALIKEGDIMAEKGLGRGFGAIFGADALDDDKGEVLKLPISKVEPRQDQPRTFFDEGALAELADSLLAYGMIQPITVRKLESGYYQIIAGERRWRAARIAGMKEVPVRVLDADDSRAMQMALVENLQREDLNPIEEALGYKKLIDDYGLTQEQAGKSVGKSRPAVANILRLLNLAPEVQKLVEDGQLSAGHARALVPINDPELQLSVAKKVINQQLSARQTEFLAGKVAKSMNLPDEPEEHKSLEVDYVEEVEKSLSSALGRRVKISRNIKKGKIELEYYGREDMDALISALNFLGAARGGGKNGK